MSTLEILSSNKNETIQHLMDEYQEWSRQNWRSFPNEHYPTISLPKGVEQETIRQILVEARMKEGLSFRFWWAAKLENGDTEIFMSLESDEAINKFVDICNKHCTLT